MTGLFVVVVAAGLASLTLAIVGRRHSGRVAPVLDCVMLAAMVDVHVSALGAVPAPLWSLLLVGCAIASAFTGRLRGSRHAGAAAAHLHSAGMLLGAVLVLLVGVAAPDATALAGPGASGIVHAHGAVPSSALVVAVAAAVAAYAVAVVWVVLRRPGRVEVARCLASLAGLLAMAAMVALPALN